MAAKEFIIIREAGGRHSTPQVIATDRSYDKMIDKMEHLATEEVSQAKERGERLMSVYDEFLDVIEVRDRMDGMLISWYELKERTAPKNKK